MRKLLLLTIPFCISLLTSSHTCAQVLASINASSYQTHPNLGVEYQWQKNSVLLSVHLPTANHYEYDLVTKSNGKGIGASYKRIFLNKNKFSLYGETAYQFNNVNSKIERPVGIWNLAVLLDQNQKSHQISEFLGLRWLSGKRIGFDFYAGPTLDLAKRNEFIFKKDIHQFSKGIQSAVGPTRDEMLRELENLEVSEYQMFYDELNRKFIKKFVFSRLGVRVLFKIG
jgi:hypothetical protein